MSLLNEKTPNFYLVCSVALTNVAFEFIVDEFEFAPIFEYITGPDTVPLVLLVNKICLFVSKKTLLNFPLEFLHFPF